MDTQNERPAEPQEESSPQSRMTCGSIYKRPGRDAWYVAWIDYDGKRRERSTRTTDRAAAERILAKYTADAALRREGVIDPRVEHVTKEGRKPIEIHLADWQTYLESKRNTKTHVRQFITMATKILATAGVTRLRELSPTAIMTAVNGLMDGRAAARTRNHSLRAVLSFSRWCLREGRLPVDPLVGLSEMNTAADRRLRRRPLDEDEVAWLLRSTEGAPKWRWWKAEDRIVLYRIALGTGFRKSEIMSLKYSSFDLDGQPPCVTVEAGYSKRRREDRQPIRADLAELLRPWLAERDRRQRLFRGGFDKIAKMLTWDLRRAKARWIRSSPSRAERRIRRRADFLSAVDAAGRVVDFHALRMTYITALVRGGASVKVAQTLARHCTPVLTLNTYTALGLNDLVGALDALPGQSEQLRQECAERGVETYSVL